MILTQQWGIGGIFLRVREMSPNQGFSGLLAVRKVILKQGANGPYLDLRLWDGADEITGRVWKFTGQLPKANTVLLVEGTYGVYNGQPQVILSSFNEAGPDEYRPDEFLPRCPADPDYLWDNLLRLAGQVTQPHLKQLLALIFGNEELAWRFHEAPAAVHHHHAYLSGLMEHTLAVAGRVLAMEKDGDLDYDLLLTGALLHDLGKLEEYDWSGVVITTTNRGRFLGHIVLGLIMLEEFARKVPGLEGTLLEKLLHIVASHHGKLEWGSPVEPHTREALMVHLADLADARLFQMKQAKLKAAPDENWVYMPELGQLWTGD